MNSAVMKRNVQSAAVLDEVDILGKRATSIRANKTDRSLPLWLKIGFTAFMATLVPIYWIKDGPTNFLYFCDMALF